MEKRLFLILFFVFVFNLNLPISCMGDVNDKINRKRTFSERNEQENIHEKETNQIHTAKKLIINFNRNNAHLKDINDTLKSAGLLPDLCKIIGEYDDGFILFFTMDRPHADYLINKLIYISEINSLVSGSSDGTIKLWCLDKLSNLYQACTASFGKNEGGHTSGIFSMIYIPNLKYLASSSNSTIKLWDLDASSDKYQTCVTTFDKKNDCHNNFIYSLIDIPDLNCLASAGFDRSIKLWNLDKSSETYLKCIANLNGHTTEIFSLTYIKDLKLLASGSNDNTIKLWDLNINNKDKYLNCISTLVSRARNHLKISYAIYALTYIPDIKCLVCCSGDTCIDLWNLDPLSDIYQKCWVISSRSSGGHQDAVGALIYIPELKCLVSGSDDKTIKLTDLDIKSKTYQTCFATLAGHTERIRTIAYIKDYGCLASGGPDKTIKLWINMKYALGNFNLE